MDFNNENILELVEVFDFASPNESLILFIIKFSGEPGVKGISYKGAFMGPLMSAIKLKR